MQTDSHEVVKLATSEAAAALTERDLACLNEIRDVLQRHNALERFGVWLIHEHFSVAEDEVLIEDVDAAGRLLTIRPKKVADLEGDYIETMWKLSRNEPFMKCALGCSRASGESHVACHVVG